MKPGGVCHIAPSAKGSGVHGLPRFNSGWLAAHDHMGCGKGGDCMDDRVLVAVIGLAGGILGSFVGPFVRWWLEDKLPSVDDSRGKQEGPAHVSAWLSTETG